MRNRPDSSSSSSIKQQSERVPHHLLPLDIIKAPASAPPPPPIFFQCPISLEVMQSPVILSTGVTYDRSSIQKWLDSGNTTCPATMLPLPSTDLVPNLTLRRLIQNWLDDIPSLSDPQAGHLHKLQSLSSSALASLFLADNQAAAAATVLETLIADQREAIIEKPDLITELMKLIGESKDAEAVDAGLRCLMGLITGLDLSRRVRQEMVKKGAVAAVTKVMTRNVSDIPAAVAEKAIRVMRMAADSVEGRAEICGEAGRCVEAVVGRMMSVGKEGREAAVEVLWRVCCAGGGDRRAREALGKTKGGMGKILVVMQGGCSPPARKMAGDLLRVFPADAKRYIAAAGFQSRRIHISPF